MAKWGETAARLPIHDTTVVRESPYFNFCLKYAKRAERSFAWPRFACWCLEQHLGEALLVTETNGQGLGDLGSLV
jgi:hypothetical protein